METKDCILTRRSVRKFTDRKVEHRLVEQIISLAAYAPSWKRQMCIRDSFNARIIGNCPLLIAQTFVKGRSGFERDGSFSTDREAGWQYYDCGIACQTLCLAAHDLGLGTVVMGVFDRKGLEAYLQIPEDQELMALIALGYPDESPAAPRRKETSLRLSYR